MGFYKWRLRLSLDAAREAGRKRIVQPDPENLVARWREAMARERSLAWPKGAELIPVRVRVNRPRD
jgi:hypothetical protein